MQQARPTKYIFVTGGVLSSLGKGLASASIGALLEARGLIAGDEAADSEASDGKLPPRTVN